MRFFTSDHHFGHANIIKYCNRPFDSVEQMDAVMINNWNKVVGKEDEVWFLGDFAMSYDRAKDIAPLLNGYKIIILGNHDKGDKKMLEAGFQKTYQQFSLTLGKKKVILQHRPKPLKGYDVGRWQLSGHTHNHEPKVDREKKIVNCSVEHWDYTPIPESEILKIIRG